MRRATLRSGRRRRQCRSGLSHVGIEVTILGVRSVHIVLRPLSPIIPPCIPAGVIVLLIVSLLSRKAKVLVLLSNAALLLSQAHQSLNKLREAKCFPDQELGHRLVSLTSKAEVLIANRRGVGDALAHQWRSSQALQQNLSAPIVVQRHVTPAHSQQPRRAGEA